MAPKRKMANSSADDENERALFPIFQNVANNLCQLYSQGLANQKLAFEAGQRYSYEWIAAKLQEGKLLTVPDVLAYMQDKMNELTMAHTEQRDCGTDQNGASASHAELTTPSSSGQRGINCPDVRVEMNRDAAMEME